MNVRRTFIDGKYGQIHLRHAGQSSAKTPVLCLHMVPKSSRSYAQMMSYLAEDRLVIAPDYPGYGESDPPPEHPAVSIADYAQAVLSVLKHFQLPQVDLIGYHTGAMVSAELAVQQPQRVRRLIQISAPVITPEEVEQFLSYYSPVPLDEAGTRFTQMWQRILHYRGPGMTLEMAATSLAENLRAGEAYEWGHHAAFMHAQRYAESLAKLAHPIWVMNLNDDLCAHTRRVDALLSNGHRTDFPNWGAGFLDLYSQEVAAEVRQFFDDPAHG